VPASDVETVLVDSLKALDLNRPIREEKRVPASDVETVLVDSLKALDLNRPIREADMSGFGLLPCKLTPDPHFVSRKLLL
jgi:hypothetical protein